MGEGAAGGGGGGGGGQLLSLFQCLKDSSKRSFESFYV